MSIELRSRQYGKIFDHWQIKEFLGQGSQGKSAVFRLVHSRTSSVKSALKVVNLIEETGDLDRISEYRRASYEKICKEYSDRAEQEVLMMDLLQGHTNVVDYLDHTFVDWSDETSFGRDMLIRMELLRDLRDQLSEGRMFSEQEAIGLGIDICTALVLCHGKDILHRDIKPENIFYSEKHDNYKLGDFGIARILSNAPSSKASTSICTPAYAAPEQMRGDYDRRVDIYSLGLVLYELCNGNALPFASPYYIREEEITRRLNGERIPFPCNASSQMAAVILKACAFRPGDRYQTAKEFLDALVSLRDRQTVSPLPVRDVPSSERIKPAQDPWATQPSNDIGRRPPIHDTEPAGPAPVRDVPSSERIKPAQDPWATQPSNSIDRKRSVHGTAPAGTQATKILLFIAAALVVVLLVLCFFTVHIWDDPTCTDGSVCKLCGKEKGAPLGHEWAAATCIAPKTCEVCGATEGTYADHQWVEASFDAPKTCYVCATVEGKSLSAEIMEKAEAYVAEEQYRLAIQCLDDAWRQYGYRQYYDAAAKYRMEFGIHNSSKFAAGRFNTVFIRENGTVDVVGENTYHEHDASRWSDIVAVSNGDRHIVGITTYGSVIVVGDNAQDQLTGVRYWSDVVAVSAGDVHTVGLLSSGRVVASEGNNYYGQCDVDELMRKAGQRRVVAVSAGYVHTLALLEDGTVVAIGDTSNGACSVSGWSDIAAIYTGSEFSAGLRTDGTVVVTGLGTSKWDLSGWTDLVALAAGDYFLVGLKADGTVVAEGIRGGGYPADKGQFDVSGWRNIVHIAAGNDHTVGLSSDGRVWCVGGNEHGQCDRSGTQLYTNMG